MLRILPESFSVCRLESLDGIDFTYPPVFLGVTDSEIPLVCETDKVPFRCRKHEDSWRALMVVGSLDFSLTGVFFGILAVLAEAGIAVFVVSTYQPTQSLSSGRGFPMRQQPL